MKRREFLGLGAASWAAGWTSQLNTKEVYNLWLETTGPKPPAFSVIPVVGDGKWIWKEPPEKERGYVEPRDYSLDIGIEMEGIGAANNIYSTTTVPVEFPEQKVLDVQLETVGCQAVMRQLSPEAAQLVMSVPQLERGQKVRAIAHYRLKLSKQYFAYERDQFPAKQSVPRNVQQTSLQDSPGIQTKIVPLRKLARELTSELDHPWDKAHAFAAWIPKHIQPQIGSYTSVEAALKTQRGDCEEMAGLFVALCRAVNIPARLVWVPNHVWAEFFLVDKDDTGHWIPAHTACYSWFGYNGAHELVLQKGDRLDVPERPGFFRLLEDWTRYQGRRPKIHYTATLTPLPAEPSADPGPGARSKNEQGEWLVTGEHPLNRYIRR